MGLAADLLLLLWRLVTIFVDTIFRWIVPARYKAIEGEVCLITGAGSGLGRQMSLRFAERKARLVLWDIDEQGLEGTKQLIEEAGGFAFVDVCDVSNKDDIRAAAVRARRQVGDVTILVNNAGIVFCKELMELTEEEIERTLRVNALAHFWMNREFLPAMMERNRGHLVTIASSVGLIAAAGMPDYVSSKHAAVGLHQALCLDLINSGKTGVSATLVCPYHVGTGMFTGVRLKHPFLLPSLTTEQCVDAIMHAVLTDRAFVAIPRAVYLLHNLTTWLPLSAQHAVYAFAGADRAISKFVPNRQYQLENARL